MSNSHQKVLTIGKIIKLQDALQNQYVTMEEYPNLGHIVEVPSADKFSKKKHYFPHDAVRNLAKSFES